MLVLGINKGQSHYAKVVMETNDIDEAGMFAIVLQRALGSNNGWNVQLYKEETVLKPINI